MLGVGRSHTRVGAVVIMSVPMAVMNHRPMAHVVRKFRKHHQDNIYTVSVDPNKFLGIKSVSDGRMRTYFDNNKTIEHQIYQKIYVSMDPE